MGEELSRWCRIDLAYVSGFRDMALGMYIEFVQLGSNTMRSDAYPLSTLDCAWKQYLLYRIYDTTIMWMEVC